MTNAEILILAAERFNTAELAAAAGMTPESAQMAHRAALTALDIARRRQQRKARNERYRAKQSG